jgi:DnaJ-class molecular chaperone
LIGWGWIDDVAIVLLLWWYFSRYLKKRYARSGYTEQGYKYSSSSGQRKEYTSQNADSRRREHFNTAGPKRDPHAVLGVPAGASAEEIKQAYKRLAGKYHPDKVQYLGEEFQELAEKRFKEIQKAYRELSGGFK